MTEDEIKEVFEEIDSDGDGQINTVELANYFKRKGYQGQLKDKVQAAMKVDKNRDRVINFEEFHDMLK
ncbi:EF-hand domain-containing protein [Streptomyces sp. 900105245]